MEDNFCPCTSGMSYPNCCKPFHDGKYPENALQLMRSRYSAMAYNKPEYIVATTHLASPQYQENKFSWKRSISQFSTHFSFNKLEILDFKERDNIASVTFTAFLSHEGKDTTFTERSLFEKVGNKWYYKNGLTEEGRVPDLIAKEPLYLLPLAYYGDHILRKKAAPIQEINEEIVKLVEDMTETMLANNGVGLAAPQVHHSLQLFIIRKPYIENENIEYGEVQVFINPVLSSPSKETWEAHEGCLSIPSIHAKVERPIEITVVYTNLKGERITERFSQMHAKMIMHENDHIQGVLFIDRLSDKEKLELKPVLKKLKERISIY